MTDLAPPLTEPLSIGRYVLHREIAAGGMGTVYFGRLAGPAVPGDVLQAVEVLHHVEEDRDVGGGRRASLHRARKHSPARGPGNGAGRGGLSGRR